MLFLSFLYILFSRKLFKMPSVSLNYFGETKQLFGMGQHDHKRKLVECFLCVLVGVLVFHPHGAMGWSGHVILTRYSAGNDLSKYKLSQCM